MTVLLRRAVWYKFTGVSEEPMPPSGHERDGKTSRTSLHFYHTMRRKIPKQCLLDIRRNENVKFHRVRCEITRSAAVYRRPPLDPYIIKKNSSPRVTVKIRTVNHILHTNVLREGTLCPVVRNTVKSLVTPNTCT
jgi:hypothetical protein